MYIICVSPGWTGDVHLCPTFLWQRICILLLSQARNAQSLTSKEGCGRAQRITAQNLTDKTQTRQICCFFRLKLWFASNYDTGQIHIGLRLAKPKFILVCDIGRVEFAHQWPSPDTLAGVTKGLPRTGECWALLQSHYSQTTCNCPGSVTVRLAHRLFCTVSAPNASSRVSQLNFPLLCSSMIFPFPQQGYSFPLEKSYPVPFEESLVYLVYKPTLYQSWNPPALYLMSFFFSP